MQTDAEHGSRSIAMSMGGVFSLSTKYQVQCRSACLLPFLYQTQTLLSKPPKIQRKAIQLRRSFRSCASRLEKHSYVANGSSSRNNRSNDGSSAFPGFYRYKILQQPEPQNQTDSSSWPRNRSRSTFRFDVPFKDVEAHGKPASDKSSTMTNFEKATFDRIYKDIERSSPADDLDEVDEGSEKEIAAGVEWNSKANLESIFDAAIQRESETQKIKEVGKQRFIEEAPRTDARRFESPGFRTGMAQKVGPERVTDELLRYKNEPGSSREFRRPLRLANGAVFGEGMDTEEHRERVKKACDDHRKLVNGMYYRARTDLEIWKLLEREVFKMLEHLNKQIEMRENFESGKGTKTKGNKKKDRTTPIVSEKTRVTKTDESIAIPIDVLYAIISANYSNYLLSALRMLRRYHPSSPYCLALLPAVKRLGSISYVLAGNGAFYNELIFLRWTQYSDLHGIADLLEEMLDQGIKTNTITGMLMKRLRKEKRQAMLGRGGPVVKAWWSLRGTEEAWQRVTGAEWRIRRAEAEEDADRAKEGEERREHEREDWEGLLSRVTV